MEWFQESQSLRPNPLKNTEFRVYFFILLKKEVWIFLQELSTQIVSFSIWRGSGGRYFLLLR